MHSQSHDFRNAFIVFDEEKLAEGEDSMETLVEFKEVVKYKNGAMKIGKTIGINDEEEI